MYSGDSDHTRTISIRVESANAVLTCALIDPQYGKQAVAADVSEVELERVDLNLREMRISLFHCRQV